MASIEHRITILEEQRRNDREEIHNLKIRVAYYDTIRLRWGGFLMGAISLSAGIPMFYDTLKEKLLHVFLR